MAALAVNNAKIEMRDETVQKLMSKPLESATSKGDMSVD